jgi:cell wall-associated NlpC family hydrolase
MQKLKNINWRKGTGSVIVGMFIILTCFSIALILMEHGNLFNQASRVQMRADAIADGATVWAQTPLSLDEAALDDMAAKIANANQDVRNDYIYHIPVISDDYNRSGYVDKDVTVQLEAKTPLLLAGINGETEISVGSKVRAISQLTAQVQLTADETQIITAALDALPSDSAQYKAILNALPMMGWIYSQQNRWVDGYRDCSSFVISAFMTDTHNYGISGDSRSVLDIAINNGWVHPWFAGFFSNTDSLQPGDVLYWREQWAVDEGLPYGLGHVGIYLGNEKIIHCSPTSGRVVITNLFGAEGYAGDVLIGYSRQPY